MSWNIDILAFTPITKSYDDIVPDIFVKTDSVVSFEDATSSRMRGCLTICEFNDITFLIDPNARIGGKLQDFAKLTNDQTMHYARVTNNEITSSYKNNKQLGIGFIQRLLGNSHSVVEYSDNMDGEQRAWHYLSHHTGVKCPDDLHHAKFTVYRIDL